MIVPYACTVEPYELVGALFAMLVIGALSAVLVMSLFKR